MERDEPALAVHSSYYEDHLSVSFYKSCNNTQVTIKIVQHKPHEKHIHVGCFCVIVIPFRLRLDKNFFSI
jgi:hypothetical protein